MEVPVWVEGGPRWSRIISAGSQSRCSAANAIIPPQWVSQEGFVLKAQGLLLLV